MTLTLTFTESTPAPAFGYRIKYWDVIYPGVITTVLVPGSPAILTVPAVSTYSGTVEALCDDGFASTPQSWTTTCTRPTVIERYMLQSIGIDSIWYNSEGQDFTYTCNLFTTINDGAATDGFGMVSCAFTSLTVGETVYLNHSSTGCVPVVPDGAYIYTDTNSNAYAYCLANNPVQIVTIVSGVITSIDYCFYLSASNLVVWNNASTGTIDDLTLITYAIVSGAYPLASTESVIGMHTGHSGILSVDITDATIDNSLTLLKNGILLECISTSGTGTYTFATSTFASGDVLKIIYSNGLCL